MGPATKKTKSRDEKRQVSREGSEFQIHISVQKKFQKKLATFSFIR
jgi:hypothetical protein